MKKLLHSLNWSSALIALALVTAIVSAGCGNDEAPPNDPSYYKGPMKPKSAGSGTQTDQAAGAPQ